MYIYIHIYIHIYSIYICVYTFHQYLYIELLDRYFTRILLDKISFVVF